MKKFAVIIILSAIIFSACHRDSAVADALREADAMIFTAPASAVTLLDTLDLSSASDAQHAHHALLLTKARYKAYIVDTDDSLISTAVDYYRGNNDSLETQSLFYKGVILNYKGEYPEALKSLMFAADMAADNDDNFYHAMACREQADIYYKLFTHHKRAELSHQAAHYFNLADKPLHSVWERVGEAYSLAKIDSLTNALSLLDSIRDEVVNNPSSLLRANWLRAYALVKYKNKDYNTVVETLNSIPSTGASMLGNDYYILGRAYRNLGDIDSAIINLDNLSCNMIAMSDTLSMLHLKSLLYEDQGHLQEALEARKEYENLSVPERDPLIANPPIAVAGDYYEQIANLNKRLLHKESVIRNLILILGIVVIVWSILFWKGRNKRLQIQLNHLVDQLKILEKQKNAIADIERSNSALTSMLEGWIGSYELICSDFYKLPSSLTNKQSASLKNILTKGDALDLVETYVDNRHNGLMARFRKLMPDLTEKQYQIVLLLFAGFSQEAICALTDIDRKNTLAVAKYRLKELLQSQNTPEFQEFLAYF